MERPLCVTVGGQAISVQDKITDGRPADTALQVDSRAPARKWYRRWWAWILWVFLTLILALACVAIWVWSERYTLMEDLVVDSLSESGFEAELNIVSVTRTDAKIRNIRIRKDGADVIRADELRARYVWPDIRDGQLKRLELDGAVATLALGDDWHPNADWLINLLDGDGPSDGPSRFPAEGIALKDVTLLLTSPLGEATLYADAAIPSADVFDAEITLAPSTLSYSGFSAEGAGFAKLARRGSAITIEGQTQTGVLSNPNIQIKDATLRLDGTADLTATSYTGLIEIDGGPIASKLFAADAVDLTWTGEVSQNPTLKADGKWTIASRNARSPRSNRADELADILSLAPTLSVVPVTEHFTPQLVKTVRDFLVGSDLSGTGELAYGTDGFTLTPTGPVTVKTKTNQLSLTPRTDSAFYHFDKPNQTISANLDAKFKLPVGLNLTDIDLKAASENGVGLKGVDRFSANLATASDWRAKGVEGRAARLGPMKAQLSYRADKAPRQLSIHTNLDYDGSLPGGYVEGLDLQGRLDVRLYDTRQVIDFTPIRNGRITLARLETPTAWVVENADFTLPPTRNLFIRRPDVATLNAALQNAEFTLTHPATPEREAQRLDLRAAGLALEGQLNPSAQQNWDAVLTNVTYASETLPGPGTTAAAATANLTAKITPNAPVTFTLNSPSILAETPLVRISDMQIDLAGTPDTYDVTHEGGTVSLIGTEFADTAETAGLAQFPADGRISFADKRFAGQAKLRVAKAGDAEVIVDYSFADGAGSADIDVPSIKFTPTGLQPQALFPTLKGKIARVEGEAKAKLNIDFADGTLTQSSGTVDLIDVNLGTAPGPIEGLNTTLTFTSLLPLETDGTQRLTLKSFNPGLPLEDGVVTYRLLPEGVAVDAAHWPIGNGAFSLDPFTWVYAADENRVTMRVEDVSLGDFIKDTANRKIEATGNVVGVFPIIVRGVEVLVEGGKLSVPGGGVLRIEPGPNVPVYSQEEAINVIRERRASEYAALAQDALREFRYRELSAAIDGPLDGEVEIGVSFDGSNKRVLNAQPFRFNMNVAGELFNIARSFNSNAQVKTQILRDNGKLPEGVIIGE